MQLKSVESVVAGSFRADLPKYTQENVAAHTTKYKITSYALLMFKLFTRVIDALLFLGFQ